MHKESRPLPSMSEWLDHRRERRHQHVRRRRVWRRLLLLATFAGLWISIFPGFKALPREHGPTYLSPDGGAGRLEALKLRVGAPRGAGYVVPEAIITHVPSRQAPQVLPPAPGVSTVQTTAMIFERSAQLAAAPPAPHEPTPPDAALPPLGAGAALGLAGAPATTWFENTLPLIVQMFEERIAQSMELSGQRQTTVTYRERDFQATIVRTLEARFPKQLRNVVAKFRPDELVGAGRMSLGGLEFPFSFRIGIILVDGRPHAVLRELKVGSVPLPTSFLKAVEIRANQAIARHRVLLRIKRFQLEQGAAIITAERL